MEEGSEGQAVARREFLNTAEGHQALLCFLERSGGGVWVCIEPTGHQGLDLALYLHRLGVELVVSDPLGTAFRLALPVAP